MANPTNRKALTTTTTTPTMQAPQASGAALAPMQAVPQANGALAVLAPNTQPHAGVLVLQGVPSTAKQATNGIGPVPGPKTVGYAALQAIAAGNGAPVPLATVQAAVTAVGLRGAHPVMPLLRWLAAKRGYSFCIYAGTHVTLGNQPVTGKAAQ